MSKPLKQAVREHFEPCRLDDHQLSQLHALQRTGTSPIRRTRIWFLGMAAVAALVISIGYGFTRIQQNRLRQAIVAEVAANHLKQEPAKNKTHSLVNLRNELSGLNFHLREPYPPQGEQLSLLGGGYCSIHDLIAAQLHYDLDAGRTTATLYQVALPTSWDFLTKQPFVTQLDGLKVTLWVERDVLFALAHD